MRTGATVRCPSVRLTVRLSHVDIVAKTAKRIVTFNKLLLRNFVVSNGDCENPTGSDHRQRGRNIDRHVIKKFVIVLDILCCIS